MKNVFLVGLVVLTNYAISFSNEPVLKVGSFESTPEIFLSLLKSSKAIRADDVLNERLLDLVDVYLLDSAITKKTERHQFFGAAMLRVVGRRWEVIDWTKQKYIGTSLRENIRIPGKELFSEYDLNLDIAPHLKRYIDLAYRGYQVQKEIGRKKRKKNYEAAPYIYPADSTDLNRYKLHCELTPVKAYRPMLDNLFYPTQHGSSLKVHHNFGENNPSFGMYGPFCSDCNHTCHPEIHPYEWLWWLEVNPKNDATSKNSRTWLLGLFREGSNRFPNWSDGTRNGTISIPFIYPIDSGELKIDIEHLIFNDFDEDAFAARTDIPEKSGGFHFRKKEMQFSVNDSTIGNVILKTNVPLHSEGMKYWFSPLNYDKKNGYISGKFNLAISITDLYTARVKFSY